MRKSGLAHTTTATLVMSASVSPDSCLLRLDVGPDFAVPAPGQFVHVAAWNGLTLRRPFSIAAVPAPGKVELLIELRGKGTRALTALSPGLPVSVMGPLGNSFSMPEEGESAILVAGGIGVAGLRFLAETLVDRSFGVLVLVGARTRESLLDHLLPVGGESVRLERATDDGTAGFHGTVCGLLKSEMSTIPRPARVYCCGPPAMIREVARIATDNDLPCQALLEEIMACGVGACRGCVVETRHGYRTVCSDGPVFDASELIFEEAPNA